MTKIEWVRNADGSPGKTWNPIVGCEIESPGCRNCYAMRFAGARLDGNPQVPHYAGTTQPSDRGPVWTGKIAKAPQRTMLAPLKRKKPTTYFVNSMGDLFHEDTPDAWIDEVFAVMALCPQHRFQVLTKRAGRMRDYFLGRGAMLRIDQIALRLLDSPLWSKRPWPLSNVALGVSLEDRKRKDRLGPLRDTPAAYRFVSAEPLLEDLGDVDLSGIDQVICGGESGPGARLYNWDWPRDLLRQCRDADTAFFMKQGGQANGPDFKDFAGFPPDLQVREFPKGFLP